MRKHTHLPAWDDGITGLKSIINSQEEKKKGTARAHVQASCKGKEWKCSEV